MKILILLAGLIGSTAFATEAELSYDCSNENFQVRMYDADDAGIYAVLTIKTFDGGRNPAFRYNNLKLSHKGKRFGPGKAVYSNGKFSMKVSHTRGTRAEIEVPEKGISATLRCY